MKKIRQLTLLICGAATLLAHGSVAGPDQEVFTTAPAEGQLRARDAVLPSHLVAYDQDLTQLQGLMVHVQPELLTAPLPDFRVYRDALARKNHFFSYLMPLVEAENERLTAIRTRLRYIQEQIRWQQAMADQDQQWLERVIQEYRLPAGDPLQPGFWTSVFERVDALPVELVLVQAANESAWGTSRFAREGNNLFGQWCFRQGCGIVPGGRPEGATYEVARYATVMESVGSYMHNLNTGRTYLLFREIRARMREQGLEPDANELAVGLMDYSARGIDYVNELRAMLRHNAEILAALQQADTTGGNG